MIKLMKLMKHVSAVSRARRLTGAVHELIASSQHVATSPNHTKAHGATFDRLYTTFSNLERPSQNRTPLMPLFPLLDATRMSIPDAHPRRTRRFSSDRMQRPIPHRRRNPTRESLGSPYPSDNALERIVDIVPRLGRRFEKLAAETLGKTLAFLGHDFPPMWKITLVPNNHDRQRGGSACIG